MPKEFAKPVLARLERRRAILLMLCEIYRNCACRTDWSEKELHSIYQLWKTAEERRRQIIMSLMCFS
jgi:hypothetical protein